MAGINVVSIGGTIYDATGPTQIQPLNLINNGATLPGSRITTVPSIGTINVSVPSTAVGFIWVASVTLPNTFSVGGIAVANFGAGVMTLNTGTTSVAYTFTAANGGSVETIFF